MFAATEDNFRVVCLGGSAGGLEAYMDILRDLPANTGMAFVIATHRNLKDPQLLSEILAHVTAMPVVNVQEGTLLEANQVYIMPPRTDMTVKDGQFVLRPQIKPYGWPNTITLLSLAEVYGPRAVAVILSGMDQDGSAALKPSKRVAA